MWKLGFPLIEIVLCEGLSCRKSVGVFESVGLCSVKVWIFTDTSSSTVLVRGSSYSWTCTQPAHSLHVHVTYESTVLTLGHQDRLFEGSSKKQESSRKTSISALLTMPKPLTMWMTINCGKFWKRWEYQTTWPASWETSMVSVVYTYPQPHWIKATVRTGRGTTDWFQIGKGVCQACILSLCLFNLYAEYIMRNTKLEEARLELWLPGEISITSDIQMTPPLWQKVKKN